MSETKPNPGIFRPTKPVPTVQRLPDITDQTVDGFHADAKLDIVSGEADLYFCSGTGDRSGRNYLLKYYRRKNAVKREVLDKLKTVKSPFVAPVEGFGEYQGFQYTVRPWYQIGSLAAQLAEGSRFSEEHLRSLIIPSVIEGLKTVHDAGIVHKDLKPANLMPDDTGEHIVLIDFGISSYAGERSIVLTQPGMTPGYAAPEVSQGVFLRETDYYALGITVFELCTGFTPFQNPELSPDEICRLAAISKIEFPDNFPPRLRDLVLGLTYKDISHRNEPDNPNRRWGYDEIRRWLAGEDVPVPGDPSQQVLPYTFDNRKLFTASDLVRALLKNPEQGIKELARGKLTQHYGYFDPEKEELCKRAEAALGSSENEHFLAFFRLMYQISGNESSLFCGGMEYSGLADLAFAAVDEAVNLAGDGSGLSTSKTSQFLKEVSLMFRSGALEHYAGEITKNSGAVKLFKELEKLHKTAGKQYSQAQQALVFGYAFSDNRKLAVNGVTYSDPNEFHKKMAEDRKKDRSAHEKLLLKVRDELEFLVSALPDAKSKSLVQEIYDDARSAIFDDFEFQFKDADDFNSFVEKSIREGNTHIVRSILHRYDVPLAEVAISHWKSDVFKKLENTVGKMISMGEYLFADKEAFARFAADLEEEGKRKPLYLREFVRVHETYLNELAASNTPGVSHLAKELLKHKNDSENPGSIRLWGQMYPTFKKGNYVKFGSYPQEDLAPAPIEWLVLEAKGNEALLISRYAIDRRRYHESESSTTWEQCYLRTWLNNEFLKAAFSAEEQKRIKVTHLENANNPQHGTPGGNSTDDRIFCLSLAEAERYFKNNGDRKCRPTALAKAHGAGCSDDGYCWWWLRSPGEHRRYASGVATDGALYPLGLRVNSGSYAVRPALRLICNL
jgi:serine/threonine protein kinase